MNLKIKFYQVGCGDAIRITYHDKEKNFFNVFVDGGYLPSYRRILKPELNNLTEGEQIDLWILTHLDADHINGVVGYLRYSSEKESKLLRRVWFNFFNKFNLPNESSAVSFGKAIELREKIKEYDLLELKQDIVIGNPIYELGGAKITVLSPDYDTYVKLKIQWELEESNFHKPAGPVSVSSFTDADDKLQIAELSKRKETPEDKNDIVNRSSIAFLFEQEGNSILFLGDSHVSVVTDSLKNLIKNGEKIKVDYVKLSHHGSIKNFSCGILDLIDCKNFIISSNGENIHGLPNKEVLAKILDRENKDEQINFFFNYDCKRYREMFSVDKDAEVAYNFSCIFPGAGQRFILI